MFGLFQIQGLFWMLLALVTFAIEAFAFVDAASRRADAYTAADKLTKQAWLIILGLACVAHMLIWSPASILNLVGIVAALVYVLDARPALRALTRGR